MEEPNYSLTPRTRTQQRARSAIKPERMQTEPTQTQATKPIYLKLSGYKGMRSPLLSPTYNAAAINKSGKKSFNHFFSPRNKNNLSLRTFNKTPKKRPFTARVSSSNRLNISRTFEKRIRAVTTPNEEDSNLEIQKTQNLFKKLINQKNCISYETP